MAAFRQFMIQRKASEAQREKEIDEMVQTEADKVYQRMEMQKRREEEARQRLQQEVNLTQQRQLKERGC